MMRQFKHACAVLCLLTLHGCGVLPELKPAPSAPTPVIVPQPETPATPPLTEPPVTSAPVPPVSASPPPTAATAPALAPVTWNDLPGWRDDDPREVWSAFLAGCTTLRKQSMWADVCRRGEEAGKLDRAAARRFFETQFTPHAVRNPDGTDTGLVTGYYEPLLRGSRTRTSRYRFPVYGLPDDMLVVDLAEQYPELKGMRLRGRVQGRHVVPYYNRAQIDAGEAALGGREIAWVDDAIDLFFLQIQGAGRIRLDNGQTMHVGYADQNGHPYRSIGRLLVERGDLTLERASMQGIKAWARQYPDRLSELLNHNASYVFFREMPGNLPGPLGALGIPLSAGRSAAIDPRFVPLGAPVFLATTWPNTNRPLNRLMMAQDTGGAIRGAVRADFFWGFGEDATREAGRMRQRLRMWVLLPNDSVLPAAQ